MDFDVSVVIATRNGHDTLASAIASALAQERVSVEVVVVDDDSDDDTPRIAAEAAIDEPLAVRVVTHVEAQGPLESLRSGIRAANGRWVFPLADDGTLVAGSLAAMVAAADGAEASMVQSTVRLEPPARPVVTDPDDTGELSDVVTDGTATLVETRSPQEGQWEGDGALDALFGTHVLRDDLDGLLMDTALARRAMADIEPGTVEAAHGSVFLFIAGCLGARFLGRPDIVSTVLHRDRLPLDLAGFLARAANRTAAEAAVAYLNHTEGWDEHFSQWEAMAQSLAAQAVEGFPLELPRAQWAEASSGLLAHWAAPYIAQAMESHGTDPTLGAMALAQAPELQPASHRPATAMLLVHDDVPEEQVRALYDELCGRRVGVVIMTDEDVPLPQGMPLVGTLPSTAHLLARLRALDKALEDHGADCLIAFADGSEGAFDLLMARAKRLPCALVAQGEPQDVERYLSRAAQAALANSVVTDDGPSAELWRLLGCRIARVGNVVSQLTLGAMGAPSTDVCDMAFRLIARLQQDAAQVRSMRERAEAAVAEADRATSGEKDLRDTIEELTEKLQEAEATRSKLQGDLDAVAATRGGAKAMRKLGLLPS